jgi:selenide,water dikinase
MKDLEKRKRVMGRSMQLGHCICDAKKPCPCDTLREHDVCPCAGERLAVPAGPIQLTRLVDSPGCASKIDQATLRRVLAGLPELADPRVLIGMPAGDDAGVYDLGNGQALVQTVDVFSPSVDDPYTFGQIAAANSLSDVYAMGGRPITALSIVGFPIRSLPDETLREILRGGIDKMTEAGVPVVGGHSINDAQVKAGFAVTGLIDPARIVANAGARAGDRLVLTKPLGTGILAFAAQIDRVPAGSLEAAAHSMATLNRRAAEAMLEHGVHAATDVTGFGLMGHLAALAAASHVDVEIVWDELPLLPGVLACLAEGILPGGAERNRESSADALVAGPGVTPAMLDVCFDPQTSGGLLVAMNEADAERFVAALHAEGMSAACLVGRVSGAGTGRVHVCTTGRRRLESVVEKPEMTSMSCCGDDRSAEQRSPESLAAADSVAAESQAKFLDFLKTSGAAGVLDARTKRAVAIALSVLARCEPCVKAHIKKARDEGFSQDEIDEAAWMAIAFGGSPTMMFYNALRKS